MGHNYNLRSRKRLMEPEVRSPSPSATVDAGDNGDVMESGSQHRALHNEYIMAEVFSHLSVEDLKECRLVNRGWNQVATRVLAPKTPVIEFVRYGSELLEDMKRFMDTFSTTENLPCRKFKLQGFALFNASSPEQQLLLPRFIEKVAATVTHLGIHSGLRLFPWKKPKKATEYPKLKSVEFNIYTIKRAKRLVRLKSNEDFMISILQHSPNLDNITLLNNMMHKCADHLVENIPWTKICHLKLDGQLDDKNFQQIVELGTAMKLKSFEMVSRWVDTLENADHVRPSNGTFFAKFLDQQSGSLEELKLQFENRLPEPHPDFRLPPFPKLKALEVNFFYCQNTGHEMYRLLSLPSFSQRFPALSSITVTGIKSSGLCQFLRSEDSAPVETVKTLKFDLPWNYIRGFDLEQDDAQQVVRHLGQMFPHIRKLVVPVNVVIMKAIEMEHGWQNLKHLTLLCGESRNADRALMGLDLVEYKRISRLETRSPAFRQEERKIESKIFKFLSNLETLELDIADNSILYPLLRVTGFSDLSCSLVLLKLKSLRCLKILGLGYLGDDYKVTKPMIEEMSAKFRVLYKERKPEEE